MYTSRERITDHDDARDHMWFFEMSLLAHRIEQREKKRRHTRHFSATMPPRAKSPKKERPLRGRKLKQAQAEATANGTVLEGMQALSVADRGDGATADHSESGRNATGILVSEKRARDIKIQGFSLSLFSKPLVDDTTLELNYGQRYGLIGENGCGKSTLLQCIAAREVVSLSPPSLRALFVWSLDLAGSMLSFCSSAAKTSSIVCMRGAPCMVACFTYTLPVLC
jgi:ABC-type multidrug transport system fused ATPase/permease subunit